jgi:hypothetical protein
MFPCVLIDIFPAGLYPESSSDIQSPSPKKAETHAATVAIHFMHYNFARIHKALRITPAMAAGLADHVWSLEEIVRLAR